MYMMAESMGEYTKPEFVKGCETLGCDSIDKWKAVLPRLRTELKNESKFKEMYRYVFGFACEKGFKSMEPDTAVALWGMLIGSTKCKFLDKWT